MAGDEIDEKVGGAAVAGVFNLGDILELVNDGFDNETFACQQLVLEKDESISHQSLLCSTLGLDWDLH